MVYNGFRFYGEVFIVRITEFANTLGVSSQTLRNYEKRGILVPNRMPSGHRYYNESHIREAIKLGMLRERGDNIGSNESAPE